MHHRDQVGYFVTPNRVTYHLHEILSLTGELANLELSVDVVVVTRLIETASSKEYANG